MLRIQLRLAAGGWVPVCRANAERLHQNLHVEVQYRPFGARVRAWKPMDAEYVYAVRMIFRARNRAT